MCNIVCGFKNSHILAGNPNTLEKFKVIMSFHAALRDTLTQRIERGKIAGIRRAKDGNNNLEHTIDTTVGPKHWKRSTQCFTRNGNGCGRPLQRELGCRSTIYHRLRHFLLIELLKMCQEPTCSTRHYADLDLLSNSSCVLHTKINIKLSQKG